LQAGDEVAADSALQGFSAAHPELAGPLLNLALLRMRQGDESAARDYFDKACCHVHELRTGVERSRRAESATGAFQRGRAGLPEGHRA
jgi:Tfp pilus assembly protein PilF